MAYRKQPKVQPYIASELLYPHHAILRWPVLGIDYMIQSTVLAGIYVSTCLEDTNVERRLNLQQLTAAAAEVEVQYKNL